MLRFKPFKPLNNYSFVLDQIEHLISISDYEAAKTLSENLRSLALQGLHYFQTYDWFRLMTVISLGYLGWMIYLMIHVLQEYTSLPRKFFQNDQSVNLQTNTKKVLKQTTLQRFVLLYNRLINLPSTDILLGMSPNGVGVCYTASRTFSSSLSCILCNDNFSLGPNLPWISVSESTLEIHAWKRNTLFCKTFGQLYCIGLCSWNPGMHHFYDIDPCNFPSHPWVVWISFLVSLVPISTGSKLHGQENLYLDFLDYWGYCFTVSSIHFAMGLGITSFCMVSMLVLVNFHFDACWNPR